MKICEGGKKGKKSETREGKEGGEWEEDDEGQDKEIIVWCWGGKKCDFKTWLHVEKNKRRSKRDWGWDLTGQDENWLGVHPSATLLLCCSVFTTERHREGCEWDQRRDEKDRRAWQRKEILYSPPTSSLRFLVQVYLAFCIRNRMTPSSQHLSSPSTHTSPYSPFPSVSVLLDPCATNRNRAWWQMGLTSGIVHSLSCLYFPLKFEQMHEWMYEWINEMCIWTVVQF